MKRTGIADLKLHPGKAPQWLVKRMIPMADAICKFIIDEFGTVELLRRLANPIYFQALSNVLGYDWDSSGSTTVTCGVLKAILNLEEHGVTAAGGKGFASRKTPEQLRALEDFGLDGSRLVEYSRLTAKVDNAAVQDGYQLYQHVFFVDTHENWTVIQQGLNAASGDARRYHWSSENITSFVEEPHSGMISGKTVAATLNMTARSSDKCRKVSTDLIKENPIKIKRMFEDIKPYGQTTLLHWIEGQGQAIQIPSYKVVPKRMDWKAVRLAYEVQPQNYEELIGIRGIGPATIRGLALIAEMIYGTPPSWADPVRMTFAFGGKDGVPFPVPRQNYDEAITFMEQALEESKIGQRDKVVALKRLRKFTPPILHDNT